MSFSDLPRVPGIVLITLEHEHHNMYTTAVVYQIIAPSICFNRTGDLPGDATIIQDIHCPCIWYVDMICHVSDAVMKGGGWR